MSASADFKRAMRHFPTGVTVVTSLKEGEPRGITVSSFTSVSADPPTILICINRAARSYLYISSSRIFCVNVLSGDQRHLAERFAGKVGERQFEAIGYDVDVTGAPVLPGIVAHFDCTVVEEHHAGGGVVGGGGRAPPPLGYFNGGYHDFGIEVE
jgi:flavin reductase